MVIAKDLLRARGWVVCESAKTAGRGRRFALGRGTVGSSASCEQLHLSTQPLAELTLVDIEQDGVVVDEEMGGIS